MEGDEFFKLESSDKKILFWLMDHDPRAISSWTEEIILQYWQLKRIRIDREKLYAEIQAEFDTSTDTQINY